MHNLSEALDKRRSPARSRRTCSPRWRACATRGILRQDYIRNEIETKYGEYGYGDLRSDVSEKTSGALKQLLISFSATSSISARRCSRRR